VWWGGKDVGVSMSELAHLCTLRQLGWVLPKCGKCIFNEFCFCVLLTDAALKQLHCCTKV
jgi:hypothetical protein